ncbi:hypothetical protein ABZ891_29715, partial [Streptomyces sp. NPDC047023]|uniref:hypothetical protein n=1 Tax=Streptomyces sp. NPDC047023 TaxID=3155139 RepID=UPI0033ED5A9A
MTRPPNRQQQERTVPDMPPPEPRATAGGDPRDHAALDVVAYYHQPVKAPLLRGAVLPAAAAAT